MKNLRFSLIIAAAILMGGGPFCLTFHAEDPAPAPAEKKAMPGDANGDGQLSKDEFIDALADKTVKQADTNGDGCISKEEAKAAQKADSKDKAVEPKDKAGKPKDKVTVAHDQADANKDNKVSREELRKELEKDKSVQLFFERYDINHDGFIQSHEIPDPMANVGVRFKF